MTSSSIFIHGLYHQAGYHNISCGDSRYMTYMKRFIFSIFYVVAALACSNCAYANIQGVWQRHQSADIYSNTGIKNAYNNCVKILEGERYSYFQILSIAHDNRFEYYTDTHSMVFRLDNTNADKGGADLIPLSYLFPTSGALVQSMNYSAEGKYLAVAYTNGYIDIFHDDGRFFSCSDLADYNMPGNKETNNITTDLDGVFFHVATGFGYISINATTGEASEIVNLGANINYAGKVGSRMVLFDDDYAYAFNVGEKPKRLADIAKIKIAQEFSIPAYVTADMTVKWPDSLYPMTDESFIYITPRTTRDSDNVSVVLLSFDSEGNGRLVEVVAEMLSASFIGSDKNFRYKFPNEGFLSSAKDKIYFHGHIYSNIINKFKKVDFSNNNYQNIFNLNNRTNVYKGTRPEALSSTNPIYLKAATWDGEHFWVFYPREGFKRFKVSGSGADTTWEPIGEPHVADAAAAFRVAGMRYNPQFGMMFRNHGDDTYYDSYANQADGLCAFRNGHWQYLGLPKTNYAERSRMPMPKGIGIDPIDPKYVWGASRYQGLMRLNMEDPTDILQLGRRLDPNRNKPGFIGVHDNSVDWPNLSNFSEPVFDADGTMWTVFTDWDETLKSPMHTRIWYWTAEDRKASENASRDPSVFRPLGVISVEAGVQNGNRVWAMTQPKNRNLLGWTPGAWYTAFVLDHNGTLDDTSDDKVAYIEDIYDDSNVKLQLSKPVYCFEDPYDGAIIFSFHEGLLVTSREQLFDTETKRGHLLEVDRDMEGMNNRPIAQCEVTGIAVDADGRKWISTISDGVICLSPDRRTLLSHFTRTNSPLPSDVCLSVAYNPETRSIWIGTDHGLMEFLPSGAEHQEYAPTTASVAPAVVTPDYRGYVTVSGLSDSQEYTLYGPDGRALFTTRPSAGRIQLEAPTLTPGEYRIAGTHFLVTK